MKKKGADDQLLFTFEEPRIEIALPSGGKVLSLWGARMTSRTSSQKQQENAVIERILKASERLQW